VWSNPAQFCLDENYKPVEVAGCPPDGFSADGQLWGNPVYNWDYMKKTDYAWWKKRLEKSLAIYDVIRIDHFRGFDSYYCIPYGAKDAKIGEWRKGPGMNLFNSIKKSFGEIPVIAEDLGFLTESVRELLKDSGFPGMKVLQFAFDSREESDYVPYKFSANCIVYTGTHDNDTILGWTETADKDDVEFAKKFLRAKDEKNLAREMMIAAIYSVANTSILTMQDLIGLGKEARMNVPATVGSNWKWRATAEQFTDEISEFLSYYTELYGRA
jgi:4-alpha-glucanotransferase